MQYGGSVYIITNFNNSVLYIGVTSNLLARVGEHRDRFYKDSFTDTIIAINLFIIKAFQELKRLLFRRKECKNGSESGNLN